MVVDSQERELSVEEIIETSAEESKSAYSKQQVKDYLYKELVSPRTKTFRYGNTLYVVQQGKQDKKSGFFRALNADTADNYMKSGYSFVNEAYDQGFRNLATQFNDQSILNIFRNISKNPPREDMGYAVENINNGQYLVSLNLGGKDGEI
jgi:hypothetical protein